MSTTYESRIDIDHETVVPRATLALTYQEIQDIRHAVYLGIQYATHCSHDKASQKHAWDVYNALGEVAQGLLRPFVRPAAPDPQPQPDLLALQARVNQSHADGLQRMQEQQFQSVLTIKEPVMRFYSDENIGNMMTAEEWDSMIGVSLGTALDRMLDGVEAYEAQRGDAFFQPVGYLSIDHLEEVGECRTPSAFDGTIDPLMVTYGKRAAAADGYLVFPMLEDDEDEGVLVDCG